MQSRLSTDEVSLPASLPQDTAITIVDEISTNDALLVFFIKDHFNTTIKTLHFFTSLKNNPNLAHAHAPVLENLQRFTDQVTLAREHQNSELRVLDHKLRAIKTWRKLGTIVYYLTFPAVFVQSVVLPSVSAPPAAVSAANAVSSIMAQAKQCVDSFLDKLQSSREKERKAI